MTPAQYLMFLETIRLSRLRFANDPATIARLAEIESEANRMMQAKEAVK
jgi:hypothetical protein